jgi:hypothetical protein
MYLPVYELFERNRAIDLRFTGDARECERE